MDQAIVFTCRSILVAALNDIGGTEPLLANLLGHNTFQMRVSFGIPSAVDPGVMEDIVAVGESAATEHDAEESACAAALLFLWQDHKYVILDYSLLRVWCCRERHSGLLEKLQQSKSIFEDISDQSFEVFDSIQQGPLFFLRRIGQMRNIGVDDAIISSGVSCVGFLQMMHVRAATIRGQVMDQFGAMNNHENLGHLLRSAGFILPDNDSELTNISGGVRMMLDRVADILGYNPPALTVQTRGSRHRCFFHFSGVGGAGARDFKSSGRICCSVGEATETAIYNALLAFCVNRGVEINDINREAYMFAKERVDEVSSDVELLGNLGSAICSYLDSTRRGLNQMIDSYSGTLRRHPSGEELAGKLEALVAEVNQCLSAITGPVRSMNENVAVALLRF